MILMRTILKKSLFSLKPCNSNFEISLVLELNQKSIYHFIYYTLFPHLSLPLSLYLSIYLLIH